MVFLELAGKRSCNSYVELTPLLEIAGVDARQLDPVLLDFSNRRAAQKARYGGELFLLRAVAEPSDTVYLDFFQRDRSTGRPKGITAADLRGSP